MKATEQILQRGVLLLTNYMVVLHTTRWPIKMQMGCSHCLFTRETSFTNLLQNWHSSKTSIGEENYYQERE